VESSKIQYFKLMYHTSGSKDVESDVTVFFMG